MDTNGQRHQLDIDSFGKVYIVENGLNSMVMEDTLARGYYMDSFGQKVYIGDSLSVFDQSRGRNTDTL